MQTKTLTRKEAMQTLLDWQQEEILDQPTVESMSNEELARELTVMQPHEGDLEYSYAVDDYKQGLQQIVEEKEGLWKAVAQTILDQLEGYDNSEDFFRDLFHNGCVSGMIGSLVYYNDTHAFAKEHIEDILDLFQQYQDEGLSPDIPSDQDALNWLAWFGFEETARQIYSELGGQDW